eukprot:m.35302 g.35302  ORF g.35302 m.35302 type:complete len:179 (+) comp5710_c0_seq1:176-712(+)
MLATRRFSRHHHWHPQPLHRLQHRPLLPQLSQRAPSWLAANRHRPLPPPRRRLPRPFSPSLPSAAGETLQHARKADGRATFREWMWYRGNVAEGRMQTFKRVLKVTAKLRKLHVIQRLKDIRSVECLALLVGCNVIGTRCQKRHKHSCSHSKGYFGILGNIDTIRKRLLDEASYDGSW